LILGLTAAGAPLYLASVGSAAFSLEVAQRCAPSLGDVASGNGPVAGLAAAQSSLAALTSRELTASGAPASALSAPVVTMVAGEPGSGGVTVTRRGKKANPMPAQLATRTGGLDHIAVVSSAGGAGVWLSDDLAASMRIHAGQSVDLNLNGADVAPQPGLRPVAVRVAGIYRSLVGTTLPSFWCSQTPIFGAPDANFPPPPVILASTSSFLAILHAAHQSDLGYFLWEQPPSGSAPLPDAHRAEQAVSAFNQTVGTVHGFTTSRGHRIGGHFVVSDPVPGQLGFVVAHATAVQRAVREGILPGSVAGVVIAALLTAAAGSYWADRRRLEVALLAARGVSPAALGLKSSLEMILPVAIGGGAGWIAGVGLVSLLGPSSELGSAAVVESLWISLGAAALGLVLLGLIAGLRARGRIERPPGSRRSRLSRYPFECVGLALAAWSWLSLGHVTLEAGATSAQAVQPVFLIFPLVFLLSFIALAARVVVAILRRPQLRESTNASPVPLWLAVRRLAGSPSAAALLVASVAAALGVFVYSAALTRSEESTVHAKAELFVGSDIAANISSLVRLPTSLSSIATEVLVDRNDSVGSTDVDVIGVNPTTFDRGAFWDSSFASQSLAALMNQLSSRSDRPGPIPVIVAGAPSLSLNAGLVLAGYGSTSRPYGVDVIARAAEFPGQASTTPLIVMTRRDLGRIEPDTTVQVWAHGTQDEVLADLARARVSVSIVVGAPSVLDLTDFAAVGWTFASLQSLGILIGAVAVGGLLLFLTGRSRARALSYVLARRMGLSRRDHLRSLFIELGSLFALGAIVGAALAWVAVELVDSHLNPLPDLPPGALVEVPWASLGGSALVAVITTFLTARWAQHVTDRSRAAELLRFDD
jgi:putative ABC transport system permease protein